MKSVLERLVRDLREALPSNGNTLSVVAGNSKCALMFVKGLEGRFDRCNGQKDAYVPSKRTVPEVVADAIRTGSFVADLRDIREQDELIDADQDGKPDVFDRVSAALRSLLERLAATYSPDARNKNRYVTNAPLGRSPFKLTVRVFRSDGKGVEILQESFVFDLTQPSTRPVGIA
jgi:hypothetical protein